MQNASIYFKHPGKAIEGLVKHTGRIWPDKLYISTLYWIRFNKLLNWNAPKTFNEKLNWCKIYNRKDLYTQMADKYTAKKLVAERIGNQYVVECYGVYSRWEEIDFSNLPEQFVLKCTHDSGGAFVCRDKNIFNYDAVRRQVESNLKRNWFWIFREWPYKNIKPRIIVDHFLDDHTGTELRDYKFWCFNGIPTYMYCTIKGKNVFENFYDMDFNPVDLNHGFPRHTPEFECPSQFNLMKCLAKELSQGIPFVRVDFFQVDNKVYFGEFTFYDWGGMVPFPNYQTDEMLGELLVLPK